MSEVVLEARDIQFVRGKREILNIERFSLSAGETVALVGPNGAGKSTLLQVLALLLKPDRGVVEFRGAPANGKNVLALRRRMAVVFQEPLLLNTTVFGNVAAGLNNSHDRMPEFMKYEPLPPHNHTFDLPDEVLDSVLKTV